MQTTNFVASAVLALAALGPVAACSGGGDLENPSEITEAVGGRLAAIVSTYAAASGYPATNAGDGNTSSEWVATLSVSSANNNAWVSLDFGAVKAIDRLKWTGAKGTPYPASSPTNYTIEVSSDGSSWTKVVSRTNSGPVYDGDEVIGANGRYLRLVTTKVNDGTGWSLGLFEIWAEGSDAPPPSPTYYVSPNGNDNNAGTLSAPWRTIQKAANTVVAGDTVILMDGSYQEGSVAFNRSGTAAKPITFKAQNKWQAVLASTSGCNPGFSINASYITVKDIRFSVSPNNATCGTYTSSNVAIRAWNTVDPTPSNPTSGSAGFVADGIKVDAGPARSEGVKSNQDYTIIQNSEFGNSIELFNNKNSIIRNNVVTAQDQYGVSIFVKGGVRSAQVYDNIVHNKFDGGYGIYLGGYSCDACFFDPTTKIEAYNSVAYNNVVLNESGGTMYGLIYAGAADSAFFNNVLIGGQVVLMQGGYNTGFRASTTNPTFQNNIVVCNGNAIGWSGSYAGTLNINSNDFYGCSGVPSQVNPVVGDPMFVNRASDWHLQPGSPALNRGSVATMTGYDGQPIDVSHDMAGALRTGSWDLGVYTQ